MKTMLLATAVGLSLVASAVACAPGSDTPAANTFFTELPGVAAQAQVPNAPMYAEHGQTQTRQAQNGQGVRGYCVYGTQSGRGTWLFAPTSNAALTANPKRKL
jgi:hypothetical protein